MPDQSPENWFTYLNNRDGVTITGFSSSWDGTKDIVMPTTHDGKHVTLIKDYAFYGEGLTSVIILDNVTSTVMSN